MNFDTLFQKPIALDPGVGGTCIMYAALQPADIIVSTTSAGISGAIRVATGSVVSHAKLYIGNNEVVEAIGTGVTRRTLDDSLGEDRLAVAYRYPHMTDGLAKSVINSALSNIGAKYSVKGAILAGDQIACRIVGPQPASFFCSQLVAEAFRQAGAPLTELPSQCVTPEGIVNIATQKLTYVGHLKGDPAWFPVLSP